MVIAKIIKWYQLEIYNILGKIYSLDMLPLREVTFELDEDECPEFIFIKELMEKPRGVKL